MSARTLKLALAFVLMAVAITYTVNRFAMAGNESLYRSALVQCQRGNERSEDVSTLAQSLRVEQRALIVFGQSARAARLAAFRRSHQPDDLLAAKRYANVVRTLQQVRFPNAVTIDCNKAVPKP